MIERYVAVHLVMRCFDPQGIGVLFTDRHTTSTASSYYNSKNLFLNYLCVCLIT